MTSIRKAAVAGMFYPADEAGLRQSIAACIDDAAPSSGALPQAPKALIAPHAGYIYSGAIAASAYGSIAGRADIITRVILLGPSHRVGFRGLALPGGDGFETPLGIVPLDHQAIAEIAELPQVSTNPAAHQDEHSLEVHLPFLQTLLGRFSLVPLVVGQATAEEVAEILDILWGGPETLIVVSSDLSHYHDYRSAQAIDRATSDAIEALDDQRIGQDAACGRIPLSGLLQSAKRRGLTAHLADLRNSGDTAGPRDKVVGYGAWTIG